MILTTYNTLSRFTHTEQSCDGLNISAWNGHELSVIMHQDSFGYVNIYCPKPRTRPSTAVCNIIGINGENNKNDSIPLLTSPSPSVHSDNNSTNGAVSNVTSLLKNVHLYALEGLNGVNLSCFNNNLNQSFDLDYCFDSIDGIIIYCTQNLNASCMLTFDKNDGSSFAICNNESTTDICEDFMYGKIRSTVVIDRGGNNPVGALGSWAHFSFSESNSILAVEMCLMVVLVFDLIGLFIHRNTQDSGLRSIIKFYYFSFIFLCLSLIICVALVLHLSDDNDAQRDRDKNKLSTSDRIIEYSIIITLFGLVNLNYISFKDYRMKWFVVYLENKRKLFASKQQKNNNYNNKGNNKNINNTNNNSNNNNSNNSNNIDNIPSRERVSSIVYIQETFWDKCCQRERVANTLWFLWTMVICTLLILVTTSYLSFRQETWTLYIQAGLLGLHTLIPMCTSTLVPCVVIVIALYIIVFVVLTVTNKYTSNVHIYWIPIVFVFVSRILLFLLGKGMKLKILGLITMGAMLGIWDIITDINVVIFWISTKDYFWASCQLGFVLIGTTFSAYYVSNFYDRKSHLRTDAKRRVVKRQKTRKRLQIEQSVTVSKNKNGKKIKRTTHSHKHISQHTHTVTTTTTTTTNTTSTATATAGSTDEPIRRTSSILDDRCCGEFCDVVTVSYQRCCWDIQVNLARALTFVGLGRMWHSVLGWDSVKNQDMIDSSRILKIWGM